VENPDPFDQAETILQMADKRAHVMATRRTTGASRRFTQDDDIVPEMQGKIAPVRGRGEDVGSTPSASPAAPSPQAEATVARMYGHQAAMAAPTEAVPPAKGHVRAEPAKPVARDVRPVTPETQKLFRDLRETMEQYPAHDPKGKSGRQLWLAIDGWLVEVDKKGVQYRATEVCYQAGIKRLMDELSRRMAAGEKIAVPVSSDDDLPF
jgi:hypothetical protein